LRPQIEQALDPDRLSAVGVLNPDAVRRLWKRYLENPAAVGWSRLWTIFVLARWCEIMQVKV
jgi:asparagine synthase (glutamine-hydrolysing)